jgi:hypothetical protein
LRFDSPSEVGYDELVELAALKKLRKAEIAQAGVIGDSGQILDIIALYKRSDEGF